VLLVVARAAAVEDEDAVPPLRMGGRLLREPAALAGDRAGLRLLHRPVDEFPAELAGVRVLRREAKVAGIPQLDGDLVVLEPPDELLPRAATRMLAREHLLQLLVAVRLELHGAVFVEKRELGEVRVEIRPRPVPSVPRVVGDVSLRHSLDKSLRRLASFRARRVRDQPDHDVNRPGLAGRRTVGEHVLLDEEAPERALPERPARFFHDPRGLVEVLLVPLRLEGGTELVEKVQEVRAIRLRVDLLEVAHPQADVEDAVLEQLGVAQIMALSYGSLRSFQRREHRVVLHRSPRIAAERLDEPEVGVTPEVTVESLRVQT